MTEMSILTYMGTRHICISPYPIEKNQKFLIPILISSYNAEISIKIEMFQTIPMRLVSLLSAHIKLSYKDSFIMEKNYYTNHCINYDSFQKETCIK